MDYFFLGGGGRTLLLRDGWDAVSQFSGRDGRQTGVCKEGWEVDILVTATDLWSVH